MYVEIQKKIGEQIGIKALVPYGFDSDWNYSSARGVHISSWDTKRVRSFKLFLSQHTKHKGIPTIVRDLGRFIEMREGKIPKAPSCRMFEHFLIDYMLKNSPRKQFFKRDRDGQLLAYYVESVDYVPKSEGASRHPEHVRVELHYRTLGRRHSFYEHFYYEHCVGCQAPEAVSRLGYMVETPELVAEFKDACERYDEHATKIGRQFWSTGTGNDEDIDGNPAASGSWWSRRSNIVDFAQSGRPSRVVVDVFHEDPKDDSESRSYCDVGWWIREARDARVEAEDADEDEEEAAVAVDTLVPVHPEIVVYDFRRSLRLRTHVNNLTRYIYDRELGAKLILPTDTREVVDMLVNYNDGFKDIVKGKSGGCVVLLAGPPGVGKTLTAEVYAESEGRPLFSVQCSQLGTDPDTIEDNLRKTFMRAKRWNAILLLDEADVYVRQRASDLTQNAIVGVFLRVLEYQSSVLFLTTNRPDDVDDAVASRCIAGLSYTVPSGEDQIRIWTVLANTAGIDLSPAETKKIVKKYPKLSGRDIKNTLKLAVMFKPKKPVTLETVDRVIQYNATRIKCTL